MLAALPGLRCQLAEAPSRVRECLLGWRLDLMPYWPQVLSFPMSCPVCKGTDRRQIGPGYFECTPQRAYETEGPGFQTPGAGPPVIVRYRECGTRFQEGSASSSAVCSCGTFAIGMCGDCGRPVCGDHSALVAGRRLCDDEIARISQERAAEEEQERAALALAGQQQREHQQALRNVVPDFLRAMNSSGNPGAIKVRGVDGSVRPKKTAWRAWSISVASVEHGNGDIGRWTREEELLLSTGGEWIVWLEPKLPNRKRLAFPAARPPDGTGSWAGNARRLGEIAEANGVTLSPASQAALRWDQQQTDDRISRLSSASRARSRGTPEGTVPN